MELKLENLVYCNTPKGVIILGCKSPIFSGVTSCFIEGMNITEKVTKGNRSVSLTEIK